jgi:tetratricopeptide (TPR) repeat protein
LAVELRRLIAGTMTNLGQAQRGITLLDEAEALAMELDDRAPLARVLGTMSWARRDTGDLDGAMAAASRALDIALELDSPFPRAVASYRLGQAFNSVGDFSRAAELMRTNVEAAFDASDPAACEISIDSRAWLARILASLGEFADGRSHGEEALRRALVRQGPAPIIAYGSLGFLHLAQGDLEAAIRVLEPGLALGRAVDERAWSPGIAGALGEAYARAGRLAEGLALLEDVFKDAFQRGSLSLHLTLAWRLSAVYLLAGRLDEARQHALQALDSARQRKARGQEADTLLALGNVRADPSSPNVQEAEKAYREAMTLAEPRGMRPLVAHCHLGLGKLCRRTGNPQEAQEHLTTATTMYREMEMRFWLEKAEAAIRGL